MNSTPVPQHRNMGPHKDLHEISEMVTPASIGGMGSIQFPTETETGSGDIPSGKSRAKKSRSKMKLKNKIKMYEEFLYENTETVSESLVNEARSINKIQKDWANVTDMMKDAVANWKSATGKDKEDLLDQLKVLTISKKKLEAELNDAVMGKDKDAELVGALESLVIESSMSEIDIIAQEAKNLKEFIKEVVASFKLEDTKELRAWLTTLYTPYQR